MDSQPDHVLYDRLRSGGIGDGPWRGTGVGNGFEDRVWYTEPRKPTQMVDWDILSRLTAGIGQGYPKRFEYPNETSRRVGIMIDVKPINAK